MRCSLCPGNCRGPLGRDGVYLECGVDQRDEIASLESDLTRDLAPEVRVRIETRLAKLRRDNTRLAA